jgi:hypothetical protein
MFSFITCETKTNQFVFTTSSRSYQLVCLSTGSRKGDILQNDVVAEWILSNEQKTNRKLEWGRPKEISW